jgi:hypothetical protein
MKISLFKQKFIQTFSLLINVSNLVFELKNQHFLSQTNPNLNQFEIKVYQK